MFFTLSLPRKIAAGVVVVALLSGAAGGDALAQTTTLETPTAFSLQATRAKSAQPDDNRLLAHHEGATSAASSLLAEGISNTSEGSVLESLWGSLLVSMAYRRDPAIKTVVKKMNRSNNAFLLSIAGVSGLGLAQNITVLSTLNAHQSAGRHHEEGEGHTTGGHRESTASSIMGLVGSGITLGSIGVHVYMERRYKRQLERRQHEINEQISHILEQLEQGPATDQLQTSLATLVGERGAREFLQLWGATHAEAR